MRVVVERVPRDVGNLLGAGKPKKNGPFAEPLPRLMDAGLIPGKPHLRQRFGPVNLSVGSTGGVGRLETSSRVSGVFCGRPPVALSIPLKSPPHRRSARSRVRAAWSSISWSFARRTYSSIVRGLFSWVPLESGYEER